jgi:S-(hydroxymethyl)glutathione dehydrogenase/alcohol dehydrogenase
MKARAAVLCETGAPLEILELEMPALRPGQVLVDVSYSGVCHTQLLEAGGHRGPDRFLPHCLGHEGSGTVVEVGAGVTRVVAGDRVVLSWIKGAGADVPGTTYDAAGRTVNAGAITTLAERSVISENRLTPLRADVDLKDGALLGCAVPTGFGCVWNTAQARPGQSIVVFGAGGIGLCAVTAARLVGCWPIVVVDLVPAKLEAAGRLGATSLVLGGDADRLDQVREACGGAADLAVEATGNPGVMADALSVVRSQGGVAVVAGNARLGQDLVVDPRELNQGKQLRGTWGGDSRPEVDFPRYAGLLAAGRVDLSHLSADVYSLEDVNTAFADLAEGRVLRPMISMELG